MRNPIDPPGRNHSAVRLWQLASVCWEWARGHPALAVFSLALLVRLIAAMVIWLVWEGSLFADEATYSEMAAAVVEGRSGMWDGYTRWLYWDTAAWTLPLTGLYALVGPNILAGQLLSGVMGASAAALTTRLASEALPAGWAVLAGLFVAFFPSQILWSSLTLKDAAVWAVAAAVGVCVARLVVVWGPRVVGWALLLVVVLVLMAFLRTHTFVIVTWAAGIGIAVGPTGRAPARRLSGLLLLITLPWILGLGPVAIGFILDEADTVSSRRFANAVGASTAVIDFPDDGGRAGTAITEGRPPDGASLEGAELRHLPRGIVLMMLDPLPAMVDGNRRVRLAASEHVVWYPLLVLAIAGVPSVWGNRRVLAYPLLAGAATTVVYALVEGNFGTAYRHRGEIVWVVSLLAAFGAHRLWARFGDRQEQST